MSPTDWLLVATAAVFPLLMAAEHLAPARWQPALPLWRTTGIAFFAAYSAISFFLPLALPPGWFAASLLPGAGLGIAGGVLAGFLAVSLAGYAWHRAAHASPLLWRLFHQMHHAPKRLDIASATIFHPAEMVAYTVIGLGVTVFVLGLDPIAAALVGTWGAFVGIFQHMNVSTPRWIGPLVQRPESHGLHHDVHGPVGNYADLPLWDMLFGTYENPETFVGEVGFTGGNDRRWLDMLAFKDVSDGSMGQPARTPAEV